MEKQYLINFSRRLSFEYRIAEITGLARLFNIPEEALCLLTDHSLPYAVLNCHNDTFLRLILGRSVLTKTVCQLIASASSYAELFEQLKENRAYVEGLVSKDKTFCIWVDSIGKKLNQEYKINRIEALSFLDLQGSIKLDEPEVCFYLLEYYGIESQNVPDEPLQVFFGILIGKGEQRYLPTAFNLKTRNYIGNTSMDPLLSFVASNMAAVKDGDLVYDPFVGTGSLLMPAAHFGAYCFGNDINYNVVYGGGKSSRSGVKLKQKTEILEANFEQYGSTARFLGTMLADSSRRGVWRHVDCGIFDAIITDPPYGIREKAIKVGAKNMHAMDQSSLSDSHPVRFPSKIKYSFYDTFLDLLNLAAEFLVVRGRLVYWLPVVYKSDTTNPIPEHPVLQLKCVCEQKLSTSHGRLLICMEKIRPPTLDDHASVSTSIFSHQTFRDQVFELNSRLRRKDQ